MYSHRREKLFEARNSRGISKILYGLGYVSRRIDIE